MTLSCLTLCHSVDCSSLPGSSVHGILQARILEWVAIPFSRGSSRPRDQTCISCIGRQILHHWATREAPGGLWGPDHHLLLTPTPSLTPADLGHKAPSRGSQGAPGTLALREELLGGVSRPQVQPGQCLLRSAQPRRAPQRPWQLPGKEESSIFHAWQTLKQNKNCKI